MVEKLLLNDEELYEKSDHWRIQRLEEENECVKMKINELIDNRFPFNIEDKSHEITFKDDLDGEPNNQDKGEAEGKTEQYNVFICNDLTRVCDDQSNINCNEDDKAFCGCRPVVVEVK